MQSIFSSLCGKMRAAVAAMTQRAKMRNIFVSLGEHRR